MLSVPQQRIKRLVDVVFSLIGILLLLIPILLLVVISSLSTNSIGVFSQKRVGRHAEIFTLFKIKTMKEYSDGKVVVTRFGNFLRKSKLDELLQLFNVLFNQMSFVGPRPDILGYADLLKGEDRIILTVKPGVTGPATLKFSNEENILSKQKSPLEYNDIVIWPQKVEINKIYVQEWNLMKDFRYMYLTILQVFH